jgi:hypothetical protein
MKTIILTIAILTSTTAALAQDRTVTLPEDKIVVKAPRPCVERPLDSDHKARVRVCG